MRRSGFLFAMLLMLSACGDPLAGITRISEVELVIDNPVSQALPSEQEIAREGFFDTAAAEASTPPLALTPAPVTAPPPRRGGLLGLLRRTVPNTQPSPAVYANIPADAGETLSSDAATPSSQGTLVEDMDGEVQLASLTPDPEVSAPVSPKRPGLFQRLTNRSIEKPKARAGLDAQDVPYGTVLPYGTVARVCEARRQPLGRKVESAPASGYKLYDSNPGSSGTRTFYITGFDDDCPRQLSAAHVLLGEPSLYEQLHYGPTGQHLTYGATDQAYEQVKSRVCGVRMGKPCGSKMRQLEKGTLFVNSYERIDDNKSWSELLVHDSAVIASSFKDNS